MKHCVRHEENLALLAGGDLALQVDVALLQQHRLDGLGDHQQQNDCTEAATDDVEERHAEFFDSASGAGAHGQSQDGEMNAPPVTRATFQ